MENNEDNIFLKLREKMYKYVTKQNNIEMLMKDKVEPYILVDELPCPIQIGEKVIYVGNLNLKNEDYFFKKYAAILGNLNLQNMFLELLSNGAELLKTMKLYKRLRRDLTKLVYKSLLKQQEFYYRTGDKTYKLNKCSYRYFENHMNKEKLIQMMFLIWLYNYDASKKSLSLVVNRMAAGQISVTYMYNWLRECPGATGNFLLRQLPNLSWFQNDYLKSPDERKHIEENEK